MIKPDKLFYTPQLSGNVISYTLTEEESQHVVKVLRMQAGEQVHLINGKGGLFEAEIVNPHPKRCELKILGSKLEFGKRNAHIHIAIAPTKMNERLEWFLEKATEIGIDEITPVICRKSERKEIKLARLEKIIVAAMKQSVKAYLPKLNEACSFDQLIKNATASQKFIAHCYEEDKHLLQEVYKKDSDVLIMIGPEGDFSPEEIEKAIQNNFIPVSLGTARLRTETAGMVACHIVNLVNE